MNLPSPGDKATPLLVAIINGHFDIAATCSRRGADPNLVSDAGVGPLYATLNVQWAPIAAYPQPRAHLQQSRTYLEMMRLLIDKGADPNQRRSSGRSGIPATTSISRASTRSAPRRSGARPTPPTSTP